MSRLARAAALCGALVLVLVGCSAGKPAAAPPTPAAEAATSPAVGPEAPAVAEPAEPPDEPPAEPAPGPAVEPDVAGSAAAPPPANEIVPERGAVHAEPSRCYPYRRAADGSCPTACSSRADCAGSRGPADLAAHGWPLDCIRHACVPLPPEHVHPPTH